MSKIGILTFHNVINYGGVLQCYALQEFLQKQGYDVEVINYKSEHISKANKLISFSSIKNFIKSIITLPINYIRYKNYNKFINKNLNLTPVLNNFEELNNYCIKNYNFVVIGSDQVWNSDLTTKEKDIYFLQNIDVQKISYAASTGDDKEKDIISIIENSNKFKAISVREISTKERLKEKGVNVSINIDPTLLLPKNNWLNLIDISNRDNIKKSYLLLYMLNPDTNIKEISNKICEVKNIKKIYTFSKQKFGIKKAKSCATSGPYEFLKKINNADFVLTNSFHGTVLSIILRKEFLVLLPQKRPERIISLLNILNLKNRIINNKKNIEKLILQPINYENIESILEKEITLSKEYLNKNLKGEFYERKTK